MRYLIIVLITFLSIFMPSCQKAYDDNDNSSEEFTLGGVQKRINRGMSQTEVAEALGSPNIVTKNADGTEAWIYDKMASEITYSTQSGGFWLVIVGGGNSSGRVKTTQKTLTVVIRFNNQGEVDTVSYHASKY